VPAEEWFRLARAGSIDDAEVERRIAARTAARSRKDWPESDRIRDELAALGVILEDKGGATSWRRA
jgi:cysteinyl-tRNA synthetase